MKDWLRRVDAGHGSGARLLHWIVFLLATTTAGPAAAQEAVGSIRGVVYDADFEVPLPGARVTLVDTGQSAETGPQGNYLLGDVPAGRYTLVIAKDGYSRQVRADVIVTAGSLTDVDASLAGEFTEMEEYVVQDVQLGGQSEAALLELRFESPALMDSISADLMSQAGASDAASALRLVAGATVQDGKYPVIRGLPDRYVSSQMNGVRLPTADEDKRAVELDQFPAAVIESIRVSKTFTPDQQGDASGGAVDVRLKGIPDDTVVQFRSQLGYNSQVGRRSDFLTYRGGGLNLLGKDDGGRDIQYENLGENWDGAVGVSRIDAPVDYKWSAAAGGNSELSRDVRVGGFAGVFYERDNSFTRGFDDSYWVDVPGEGLVPRFVREDGNDTFITALFDVTRASETVQWGGLGTFGVEAEDHRVGLTYLYTRTATDAVTLAEDTRGKEYFFPGHDPTDPNSEGNLEDNRFAAPYVRTETLVYTERSTSTLQLNGEHVLPDVLGLEEPVLDWTVSRSTADSYQPDKREFSSLWLAGGPNSQSVHLPFKPAANFTLGGLQRIWKTIEEESEQYTANLKLPFEQWSGQEAYFKFGVFNDQVTRKFDQESFSNLNDEGASFQGEFDEFWSAVWESEDHPIFESLRDVDYDGRQEISAWYYMLDLPVTSAFSLIGGARFESTDISIVNDPERDSPLFTSESLAEGELDAGLFGPIQSGALGEPVGNADVDIQEDDILPSIGFVYELSDKLTLRGSYSKTVARQTFKEITPIIQQEFTGGPIFIGNADLQMSDLQNYDLRLDYDPYEGGLISFSLFHKDIVKPIEYVQQIVGFSFTQPVNYPIGDLSGAEVEVRQDLGRLADGLEGVYLGANATVIQSEVQVPAAEVAAFSEPNIQAPITERDMTNAPEHLYNLFLTYDIPATRTQAGLFYTVQGDTLVRGAGESKGNFIPSVYAKEFDTLNFSVTQGIGDFVNLKFQVQNITNPAIDEVFRSEYIGDDVAATSYRRGIDYSLSLNVTLNI